MSLIKLAYTSLLNRKTTTFLTILSIALSVMLLLSIERIRTAARESFTSTISNVDLIVGARGGPTNLLLYSVFRIGNATNNMSYASYLDFQNNEAIKTTIPISLGDSHKGYRVIGTTLAYFEHFQYAGTRFLKFSQGGPFSSLFDVVIGATVAERLQYKIGDKLTLTHGAGVVGFTDHKDKPFVITGILAKTGTPVDQSLHVSLKAIHAIHIDWKNGAPPRAGEHISAEDINKDTLTPSDITAFFVKLKRRSSVFSVQRFINTYEEEAMMAILPGVALRDLWQTLGSIELILLSVSSLVFVVSLVGMMIALLSTLNERRREMAILRSIGAKKEFIFSLLVFESCILALFGIILGIIFVYTALFILSPMLEVKLGLTLGLFVPTQNEFYFVAAIFVGALLSSLIPARRAYHNALADGLIIKS